MKKYISTIPALFAYSDQIQIFKKKSWAISLELEYIKYFEYSHFRADTESWWKY